MELTPKQQRRPQSRRQRNATMASTPRLEEDDAIADGGIEAVKNALDRRQEAASKGRELEPVQIIRQTPLDASALGLSALHHDLSEDKNPRKGRMKLMPMNPLAVKFTLGQQKGAPSRTIGNQSPLSARNRDARAYKLSDDDTMRICDHYVEKKWWNFAWRFMRRYWPHSWWYNHFRKIQIFAALNISAILYALHALYLQEMTCFAQLNADDQRDYQHLLWSYKIGQLMKLSEKELEPLDPLCLLPAPERVSMFLKSCREKGLLDNDPELERRKWTSFVEDFDLEHVLYWTYMCFGRIINGGSTQSWNPHSPDQYSIIPSAELQKTQEAIGAVRY